MTINSDFRLADGSESYAANSAQNALRNRANYIGQTANITTPAQPTITPMIGMSLKAVSSGLFVVGFSMRLAAVAADVVTMTITAYQDAVQGTALTLPANALAAGLNTFIDNSGAGIAPSGGATAGQNCGAPSATIGTAAAGFVFDWSQVVAGTAGGNQFIATPVGRTFYVTLSQTNSVAARAPSNVTCWAYELP